MTAQVYPVNPQNYPFGIAPEPGCVYGYIRGACPGCEEAGYVQDGHFACHLTPIPPGWEAVTAPILDDSGWVVLVRRPVEYSCPPVCPSCGRVGLPARKISDDAWTLLEECLGAGEDWEYGCVCPHCLICLCNMCV